MVNSKRQRFRASNSLTNIKPADTGWVLDMTPEMAQAAGVAVGSLVVFYFREGTVAAEILPPPSDELRAEVREIADELADALAEMKRRGDCKESSTSPIQKRCLCILN